MARGTQQMSGSSTPRERIVVTGLGLCTPLGPNVTENWRRLVAGDSAIAGADDLAVPSGRCRAMARAERASAPPALRVAKQAKFAGRAVTCALHAVQEAARMARLPRVPGADARLAVHGASGQTGLDVEEFFPALSLAWENDESCDYAHLGGRASRLVDPYFSLRTLSNGGVALVATEIGARGPSGNFVQGETAGVAALRAGYLDLVEHRADAAVVFGCDSLPHPVTWLAYDRMDLLSRRSPADALSPFDRRRDGLVLGEGAAALVLESWEQAHARRAPIMGEVLDVGVASPPHARSYSAEATGLADLLARAPSTVWVPRSKSGSLPLDRASLVVARGVGTVPHDAAESAVLGRALPKARVTAFKGATGYLGAASVLAEVVLSAVALAEGIIPAVVHLSDPDPAAPPGLVRQTRAWDDEPSGRTVLILGASWADEWGGVVLGTGAGRG